jgi:hypothetical protein
MKTSSVTPQATVSDDEIYTLWLQRSDLHDGNLLLQLRDFAHAVIERTAAGAPEAAPWRLTADAIVRQDGDFGAQRVAPAGTVAGVGTPSAEASSNDNGSVER